MIISEVRCVSCHRRPARYKRIQSGEALCPLCLERSLIKQIRRSLGRYSMLRPFAKVIFLITLESFSKHIAALELFRKATSDHHTQIIVGLPSIFQDLNEIIEDLGYETEVLQIPIGIISNWIELIKLQQLLGLKLAKQMNAEFLVLPYTREEVLVIALSSIFRKDKEGFSEVLPVKRGELSIIKPLYMVSLRDLTAYSYFRGFENYYASISKYEVLEKLNEEMLVYLTYISPELLYASEKSIDLITKLKLGLGGRCRLCYGYTSPDKEICSYCERLLKSINHD